MSIVDEVIQRVSRLPAELQREVLDFAEFLARKRPPAARRHPLRGAYAHLGAHLRAEDLAEVRREMWEKFPRVEKR